MNRWQLIVLVSLGLIASLVGGFFWNEARKEVKFLCQNFKPGTVLADVTRQLDTGTFLQYQWTASEAGTRTITASSATNFHSYQCVIKFDQNDRVVVASY